MVAERRLPWEAYAVDDDLGAQAAWSGPPIEPSPSLALLTARETPVASLLKTPEASAELIERITRAGNQAREVDAQAKAQEQRVQEILEWVRADIQNAEARVRAAEQCGIEAQARAAAQTRAAEERAKAAEERAQTAEDWLRRVHQTVVNEFDVKPV